MNTKRWYKSLTISEQMAIQKFCQRAEKVIFEDKNIEVKLEEIDNDF